VNGLKPFHFVGFI